jgi:hypothetical protein
LGPDEMAVGLVYRRGATEFAGQAAELAVFGYLGVVDKPLAADPAQQDLLLRRRRISAKSIARQHLFTYIGFER